VKPQAGTVDVVSIGEFARLSGLSPRALRLYDEVGLLRPARVDPHSGYRWYAADQVDRARLIVSLRHLGVPLARIVMIVEAEPAVAAQQVAAYWAEVEFEHHGRRALAGYLVDDLAADRAGSGSERYRVELRDLPGRRMLCLRRHVNAEELVLVGRDFIVRRMREAGVPRLDGVEGAPFAIYHGLVTADSDGPVEWCRPVPDAEADRIAAKFPDLTLRTDPAHQEAYVHRPSAQSDPEAWLVIQSLAAWAVQNARVAAEGVRMVLVSERAPGSTGPSCDIAIPLRDDPMKAR
jgi:DNA-binding transcriptional MerR regulator